MSQVACLTLDVEPDFTCGPTSKRFYGLFDTPGELDRLLDLVRRYRIPLTCFVVSQTLKDRPEAIAALRAAGAEFGSHSLTHDLQAQDSEREVMGGIETFAEYFGHLPVGYRSPRCRLTQRILHMVHGAGVPFDSSVLPSIRPGVYWHVKRPNRPFRWAEPDLVEIPISVLPGVRFPLALSYLKLWGDRVYRVLSRISSLPSPLVFLFHPMDLAYSDGAYATLTPFWKGVYGRNRKRAWDVFERFIAFLQARGYQFLYMSQLYQSAQKDALPVIQY